MVFVQIPLADVPADFRDKIAVLHAADSPLDRMTVSAICKKCGISRKKFYTLFESKYDIMYWYLDFCFSVSLYKIGRILTWREGITTCLELVEQERSFFLADYENLVQKQKSYYWPLNARRIDVIEETLALRGFTDLSAALRLEIAIYSNWVPDLIRHWIQPNDFIGLDDYVGFWLDCVPKGLYEALELSGGSCRLDA
ncbi:TetR family transcriptional regulator [Raoultibacter timonensis]|uniref:TetR family transcriptional regulator n=1 Tax=Raoultibacter timonensis TaxID=1907662 RepID=UPI0015E1737C|nr:TetR family transcriptional regulator [Raoultibacter timonensis]